MPKKPKESASPPSERFNMHFSLRWMAREGDLEEVEMEEEEENGEGTNSSGIRSGVLLNSCPSFQIRRGVGLPRQCGQDREKRVEQSEMKRNATFGMPLVFFKSLKVEIITGFPSASRPLHSSPPTMVLILKLLKL